MMRLCMPEVKRLQSGPGSLGPFDQISLSVQNDLPENGPGRAEVRRWQSFLHFAKKCGCAWYGSLL